MVTSRAKYSRWWIAAACLFWAGGARGFVVASAVLLCASIAVGGPSPACPSCVGGPTIVLLLFFGVPALLIVERVFRRVDAPSTRRFARSARLPREARAGPPTPLAGAALVARPPSPK